MVTVRQLVLPGTLLILVYVLYSSSSLSSSHPFSSMTLSSLASSSSSPPSYHDLLRASHPRPPPTPNGKLLGYFDAIKIIHLEHRTDRKERMLRLMEALGMGSDERVEFVTATDRESPRIGVVLENVAKVRRAKKPGHNGKKDQQEARSEEKKSEPSISSPQDTLQPRHSDDDNPPLPSHSTSPPTPSTAPSKRASRSSAARRLSPSFDPSLFLPSTVSSQKSPLSKPLGLEGSDLWFDSIPSSSSSKHPSPAAAAAAADPLLAADPFYPYATFPPARIPANESAAPHRFLGEGTVACWDSHVRVLKSVVEEEVASRGKDKVETGQVKGVEEERVTLILEDDVDAEFDLEERLRSMWEFLPKGQGAWDVLLLGHCRSNENTHLSLPHAPNLHPSFAPKCNHAYAVTSSGAARFYRHLRSPSYAYSRAYDQAMMHLVLTDRLTSFSVVPSIVVQEKVAASDIISHDLNDSWRDYLVDSTMARVERVQKLLSGRTS